MSAEPSSNLSTGKMVVRVSVALVATWLILSLGTAAFEDGWTLFEGLYYGMAAMTTVGFGDFVPKTLGGRLLALFLVPLAIVQLFGIAFLLLQDAVRVLTQRKASCMMPKDLVNHYVVCGYGRIGRSTVATLLHHRQVICVIDRNESVIDELRQAGLHYVIGDALDQESLDAARVGEAAGVVVTFDEDADNTYVALEVRDMNRSVPIFASAGDAKARRRLRLAGVEHAVTAPALAGDLLARAALEPGVIEMLDDTAHCTESLALFGQVEVQEGSWLAGRTIAEACEELSGSLILSARQGQSLEIAPPGDFRITAGMALTLFGRREVLRAVRERSK